jgi:hypothetical protein
MRLFAWAFGLVLLAVAAPANAQSVCPINGHTAKVAATASVSGTTYIIGGTDLCRTLVFNNTGVEQVTLPYVTTLGSGYNFWVKVFMAGTGSLVVTPSAPPLGGTAPTINGSTSLSLATTKSATIYFGTDGNWYATYSGG